MRRRPSFKPSCRSPRPRRQSVMGIRRSTRLRSLESAGQHEGRAEQEALRGHLCPGRRSLRLLRSCDAASSARSPSGSGSSDAQSCSSQVSRWAPHPGKPGSGLSGLQQRARDHGCRRIPAPKIGRRRELTSSGRSGSGQGAGVGHPAAVLSLHAPHISLGHLRGGHPARGSAPLTTWLPALRKASDERRRGHGRCGGVTLDESDEAVGSCLSPRPRASSRPRCGSRPRLQSVRVQNVPG